MNRLALFILPVFVLCACADDETTAQSSAAAATQQPAQHQKIVPQSFAPGLAEEAPPTNEAQLVNDPSAPATTPLCGSALREAAATGSVIYGDGLASGGSCAQNACFEPLTGTFIAANGSRSVCR